MKKFKVSYREIGRDGILEKVIDEKELFWMSIDWAYEIINVAKIG